MQGIETLDYEVVETSPLEGILSEGGIAQHQQAAEMLAEFGRNGDTYVVHAAEGETVIPLEVLENNPRLKRMIFTQMEEMGLEPERYVVGNELNSLNPETGQPEFFFKFLKKIVKTVVNVVKKIAPVVLAIAAPILLPAMPLALAAGIGATAGNLVQGKNLGDSLKAGVVTGITAGAGNMITGGSFLGSSIDPGNVAGLQDLGTMFTPDNPFTAALSSNISGVAADVTAAGGKVGGGVFKQDGFTGDVGPDLMADVGGATVGDKAVTKVGGEVSGEVSGEVVGKALGDAVKPETFMQGLKSAFTVGDDYGFGDFWTDFLSPGREGISAAAQKGYQTDLAAYMKKFPDVGPGEYNTFIKGLDAKYAPSLISKYAPVVGTALAGGMASDTILGTSFITPPEEESTDVSALMGQAQDLIDANPEEYEFGPGFYGTQNEVYNPPGNTGGILTNAVNPGFTAPVAPATAPIAPAGIANIPIPGAIRANPNAENQYAGMLGGDYFSQTPYSNINYYNPAQDYANQNAQGMGYASGGEIMGPGTPTSDSIPAMLSDGEFVMNANAVRGAGGGDRQEGAKRMYDMMRSFERTA